MRALLFPAIALVAACASFTADPAPVASDRDAGPPGSLPPDAGSPAEAGVAPSAEGTTLLSGLPPGSGITVWNGIVYWTDAVTGAIGAIPAAGGSATAFRVTGGAPTSPVATADGLYWCDTKNLASTIDRPHVLFRSWTGEEHELPLGQGCLALAALNETMIAFLDGDSISGVVGYATAKLARTRAVPASFSGDPFSIATRGIDVYVTQSAVARVARMEGFTNNPDQLPVIGSFASNQTSCRHLAANAAGVFWGEPQPSRIEGLTYSGGEVFAWDGEPGAHSLVADDADLYWRNGAGAVRRAATAKGSVAETFAAATGTFDGHYRTIALSDDEVFWLTADGIQKRPKRP